MTSVTSDFDSVPARPGWLRPSTLTALPPSVRRQLFIICALAVLVRVALVWMTAGVGTQIVDEQHYTQLAANLVRGAGFAWEPGNLTSLRPPLYPAFIATIWSVAGVGNLTAVRLVQVVLSLLLVLVTFQLGARLFGHRAGVIAAAAVAFYPSLLFSGVLMLSETLFTLLLASALLACITLLERPSISLALATGLIFGLGALTRSVLWPFMPVVTLGLVFLLTGRLARRVAIAGAVLAGALIVITPWSIRNTHLQKTLTVVDTMGGLNLLMGNYEFTPEHRMWDAVSLTGDKGWDRDLPRLAPDGMRWTEGGKEAWAKQQAAAYIKAHPATTIRRSLLKFADFWGIERDFIAGVNQGLYAPPRTLALIAGAIIALAYCVTMGLAWLGIVTSAPQWRPHVLLLAVVLFVCAVHTVVFGHPRYHLPLIPILLLYAAAAVDARAWQRVRWSVSARAALSVGLVVLATIWSHELFWRDADKIQQVAQAVGRWW